MSNSYISSCVINVGVPINHIESLHYFVPKDINVKIGQIIEVPFRKKNIYGVILSVHHGENLKYQIRNINNAKNQWYLNKNLLTFTEETKKYYNVTTGCVLKSVLPVSPISSSSLQNDELDDKSNKIYDINDVSLSEEQKSTTQKIQNKIKTNKAIVLHGITGSGKTEIYFSIVKNFLNSDKQVLLLVPEIGLSKQLIDQFEIRFGFKPDVWHSKITQATRKKTFARILNNQVKVMIGVRSAIFLPYKNLSCVVVDEEHDTSYKSESYFYYNARDLAVLRGHLNKSAVLLVSATPSIESIKNAQINKYEYVNISNRFFSTNLPEIKLIDLHKEAAKNQWICPSLQTKILENLNKKEKVLLFLNKRGYAPVLVCSNCGFKVHCPNCSTTLVWHKNENKMICSYCGDIQYVNDFCEKCNESAWTPCGPGVERIAEQAKLLFPKAKICIASTDTMKTQIKISNIINQIKNQEVDIIIGTQIITKGYNFPNLTLIGIIDADFALHGGDLRGKERTFQMLHQVAGRSGREGQKSEVYVQTYFQNTNFMKTLVANDFMSFAKNELSERKANNLPPFHKSCKILISSKKQDINFAIARQIAAFISNNKNIRILGPTETKTAKINNQYRIKILLIAPQVKQLHQTIQNAVNKIKIPSSVKIKIDVDPYDLD